MLTTFVKCDIIQLNKSALEEYYMSIKKAFVIVLGLWGLIFILWECNKLLEGDSNSNYSNSNSLYSTCYYYSQQLVKEQLKSPKSAEFPRYSEKFVTRNGDTVTVSAYVDAQNSFGATIRENYIATIKIKDGEPVSGSAVLVE